MIGGGLDKEVGLDGADSDGDEGFEDAEEDVREVSDGSKTRGDQGPPSVPDEKSSLAVSKWSGILTDDVSSQFGDVTLFSDDDRFLLGDVLVLLSLLFIMSF